MLASVRGNARSCLIFEPMFVIPHSLYVTYASVYMLELGVNEKEIGIIATLGFLLQIFTSMVSGYLTDRMGRRKSLLIFDLLSWSVANLLWATAQNVWFFVIAAVFNSMQRIPTTAWYCLLVEDTDPKERSIVFKILQFIGVIGGLLAPLGGWLIGQLSLVPAVRAMYAITFVSVTTMFIGRHFATYETDIGRRKKAEMQTMHWSATIKEYISFLQKMMHNRALLIIFGVYMLFQFQLTINAAFLSVYLVKYLHFGNSFIGWFPAATSLTTLLFMIFFSSKLRSDRISLYMIIGFVLSGGSAVLQILSPSENYAMVMAGAVLSAIGGIMTYPYLETAVSNTLDDDRRAGMMSVLSVLILLFVSPAGIIGGWSYAIDPRLPFGLVVLSFLFSAVLMVVYRKLQNEARHT